mgnify:CR=1 FL=1
MKYNERESLKEIEEYIESTYGEHYVGRNEFQIQTNQIVIYLQMATPS